MSILTMLDIPGDPDQILALQDEKMESLVRPIAEKNGGIFNIVVKTESGVMVVNHWENEEGWSERQRRFDRRWRRPGCQRFRTGASTTSLDTALLGNS